jgi:hypothetical protein
VSDKLKTMHEAATPGPWHYDDGITDTDTGERGKSQAIEAIGPYCHELIAAPHGQVSMKQDDANCRLITALRNATPAILDLVEEARTLANFDGYEFDYLRDALADYDSSVGNEGAK